jgi:hypothetical protein
MITRTLAALALAALTLVGLAGPASAQPFPVQHAGYHACAWEDSPGPCFWDAGSSGNGRGHSFYVTRAQRVVYGTLKWRVAAGPHSDLLPDARSCRGVVCLTVGPWHRIGQAYADALAEGSTGERHWESRCFWHTAGTGGGERLVACIGGSVELN